MGGWQGWIVTRQAATVRSHALHGMPLAGARSRTTGRYAVQWAAINSPRQSGVVLVISLILLATLSLLAVTALHVSTSQLRVIANMQTDLLLEALTQAELDKLAANPALFQAYTCDPAPGNGVPGDWLEPFVADFILDVDEPRCLDARAVQGSSALSPVAWQETLWEIRATGRDSRTGAGLALRQGIVIRLPAGQCPPAPTGRLC